jgi:peptidylprolyl isomerase
MPILNALASLAILLQTPSPTIEDLTIGKGLDAAKGDIVSLGLKVTYLNGQIFDSTFGQAPFSTKLGWRFRFEGFVRLPFGALDDAIVGMKEGGKRKIVLPSQLAYGSLEVGDLPKDSPLTFEVDLLEVHKKGIEPKLKIEETEVGKGELLAEGKSVVVHYRGTYLNGTEFDSSRKIEPNTQKPFDLPLEFKYAPGAMVKGFIEGMKGMKVGGKRKVTVPYNLAYGENGRQGIAPFSTLVFELELAQMY